MYSAPAPLVLERRPAIPGNDFKLRKSKLSQVALVEKNLSVNLGDTRDSNSISGLRRFPGGGHDNPLPYSCLENPMNRRAWRATVHGAARVRHDLVTKPPPPSGVNFLSYLPPIPVSTHPLSFFFSWPHCAVCGILIPQPGIKAMSPALGVWSLNHWTIREVFHPLFLSSSAKGKRILTLFPRSVSLPRP